MRRRLHGFVVSLRVRDSLWHDLVRHSFPTLAAGQSEITEFVCKQQHEAEAIFAGNHRAKPAPTTLLDGS